MLVARALRWPNALPVSDRALHGATGSAGPHELRARAERWRPWRAYAALHLWLQERAHFTDEQQDITSRQERECQATAHETTTHASLAS